MSTSAMSEPWAIHKHNPRCIHGGQMVYVKLVGHWVNTVCGCTALEHFEFSEGDADHQARLVTESMQADAMEAFKGYLQHIGSYPNTQQGDELVRKMHELLCTPRMCETCHAFHANVERARRCCAEPSDDIPF